MVFCLQILDVELKLKSLNQIEELNTFGTLIQMNIYIGNLLTRHNLIRILYTDFLDRFVSLDILQLEHLDHQCTKYCKSSSIHL